MILTLDHVVINSHFALDDSATLFQALGFTLTPKGYHSLGSVNHLIMFSDHYLELIGLPHRNEPLRQELLDNPPGIDGLVFASNNPEKTESLLLNAGFTLQPIQHFSREVVSGTQTGEARFTTLRLAPASFSAGRIYFCQHHTPEWVWRTEWLQTASIQGLTIVARDVAATQAQYARLGKIDLLHIISYSEWQAEYGSLLPLVDDRDSRFALMTISGRDMASVMAAANQLNLPQEYKAGTLRVAIPALTLVLEFNND